MQEEKPYGWPHAPLKTPKRWTWTLSDPRTWVDDEEQEEEKREEK